MPCSLFPDKPYFLAPDGDGDGSGQNDDDLPYLSRDFSIVEGQTKSVELEARANPDQVWSLSSLEVSCQLLMNDLNQVLSVSLLITT